ncbi:hypothetical protein JRI60_28645 [Archangium violaceum]|uniref:hypothetical protein n=1 Tax=Archangium violaceum TaxID=83451 RepID=UPI00195019CF|nr:hypothetical protein [Archangium violaceum]QRN93172.1 hypothetical protein JRI60_28645 [Archangium violaceum]
MRRWSLVLLLSTASPALGQEAQETPTAPAAPEPSAPQQSEPAADAPSESAPAPATEKPVRRRRAKQEATADAPAPTPTAEAPAPAAQPPAPAVQPAPPAAPPPAQVAAAPAQAPKPGSTEEEVRDEARYLLSALLTGDVRGSVPMLTFPFQLEERKFETPESLVVTWVKQLRNKRTDLITLYDIEVLPYAELEKKYGKPPARLGAIVPRGSEVYAAVANLSGRAAVVLYRQTEDGWKAFAYTD